MITGHELALALRSAYLSMHRRADAVLARFGVTADQFVLMAAIPDGEVLTQQELVRRLTSDASTVRAMLLLLEERGLVTRFVHPSDGRARCVTLTPKGKRALQRMIEASQSIRTRILEALGPDKDQLLKSMLSCVTEAMLNFQEIPSNKTMRKPSGGTAAAAILNPSEGVR
jgi:DNA-binding MarR family transcriptional regulator